MTDEQFRQLCNIYGFAPSRALRELIDCVRMQEIEECAKVCDEAHELMNSSFQGAAAAIRARKENT